MSDYPEYHGSKNTKIVLVQLLTMTVAEFAIKL